MIIKELLDKMEQHPGKFYALKNSKPDATWRDKWWSYEGNGFKCMTSGDSGIFVERNYPKRDQALEQLRGDLDEADGLDGEQ